MKLSALTTALLLSLAGSAALAQNAYWEDSSGKIWRNSHGECWRTSNWTREQALAECGDKPVAAVKPAPAKPAPAPVQAAPVQAAVKPAPAAIVAPAPAPAAPEPVVAPAPKPQEISLNAKGLFATGKAQIANTQELDELVSKLQQVNNLEQISIVGHTDQIGDAAKNQTLSEQRATTVRQYLIDKGIAGDKILASGKGPTQPLVQLGDCKGKKGPALGECLQPNRRIDVSVIGTIIVPAAQ